MPVLLNLQVCCLVAETDVNRTKSTLSKFLPEDRYTVAVVSDLEVLRDLLTKTQNVQDCLVIFRDAEAVVDHLGMSKIFMPTILILENLYEYSEQAHEQSQSKDFYRASISIKFDQLQNLPIVIDQAIATFNDVLKNPQLAEEDKILATPTL